MNNKLTVSGNLVCAWFVRSGTGQARTSAQRHSGTVAQRHNGTAAQRQSGTATQRHSGSSNSSNSRNNSSSGTAAAAATVWFLVPLFSLVFFCDASVWEPKSEAQPLCRHFLETENLRTTMCPKLSDKTVDMLYLCWTFRKNVVPLNCVRKTGSCYTFR